MTGLDLATADVVSDGRSVIPQGGVLSEGGVVLAWGPAQELREKYPGARVHPQGVAITPPLANAHTHLDLSHVPFLALPYFDWITGVVLPNNHLRTVQAARDGLEQLGRAYTGAFGDIVYQPGVMDLLLQEAEIPGIAYWEVLNPDPGQADEVFAATVRRLESWRRLERPGGVRVGLTPHTPFTVSSSLMGRLCEYAAGEGIPLQVHVAEHPAELELFRTGEGELARSLRTMTSVPLEATLGRRPDPALSPVRYLVELGVLEARPTLVHMVQVDEEDVRTVAQAGCGVVTCPRSNHNLDCGRFPFELYARQGVVVGLGTDSAASGETLDICSEALSALRLHAGHLERPALVQSLFMGSYQVLGLAPPELGPGAPVTDLVCWQDPAPPSGRPADGLSA